MQNVARSRLRSSGSISKSRTRPTAASTRVSDVDACTAATRRTCSPHRLLRYTVYFQAHGVPRASGRGANPRSRRRGIRYASHKQRHEHKSRQRVEVAQNYI